MPGKLVAFVLGLREFIVDFGRINNFSTALQPLNFRLGVDRINEVVAFFLVDVAIVVEWQLLLQRFLPPQLCLKGLYLGHAFLVSLAVVQLLLLLDFVGK